MAFNNETTRKDFRPFTGKRTPTKPKLFPVKWLPSRSTEGAVAQRSTEGAMLRLRSDP